MSEHADDEIARFQRIERVFAEVCDLPLEQRNERLDHLCENDETLRTSVLAMLQADRTENAILEHGVLAIPEQDEQDIPEKIGSFDIIRILGEGGMGVVYEAIQHSPKRHVALKVIRQRSTHEQIRRRFEAEADILARLNHPGIATVYESGISHDDAGATPYVAMELVEGDPITAYVAKNRLDTNARIQLIRDVCRAVGHAHTLGIVHRDLKPSNIFVDRDGQIRVLDFGIAFDMGIDHRTQMTQTGQLLGTLQYMAPEQVDRSLKQGTRTQTDVYALGILCYELLTGQNPVAKHDTSMYELVRAIRDEEMDMLGSHSRAYRGDLETIIAKALSKSCDRRYTDATTLADDLDRYLKHQPIEARRPSAWYQLSKFSQRNPVLVGSFATVMLVLVLAVLLIGNALRVATQQRRIAEHGEQVKSMVNEFLTQDLFAAGDPAEGGDPDVLLIEAMRLASSGLSDRFENAPEVEAEIRFTMGMQFDILGQFEDAQTHLERSVELSEQLGVPIEVLAERRNWLCQVYSDLNELDRALVFTTETNAILDQHPEASPEIRIDTMMEHASLLFHLERVEDACVIFERALTIGESEAPDYQGTMGARADLALVYSRLGRFEESAKLHKESIEYSIQTAGAEHPNTLVTRDNLGVLYLRMKRFEDAKEILSDVLEARLRVFGPTHNKTYITQAMLARANSGLELHDLAVEQILRTYDGMTEALGPTHRYTIITGNYAHQIMINAGRNDLALRFAPAE